jgi:hypothetical protein
VGLIGQRSVGFQDPGYPASLKRPTERLKQAVALIGKLMGETELV